MNQASPDVAVSSPPMMLRKVDLPEPDGPRMTRNSPRDAREVDAAQRLHFHFAAAIDLAQALDAEDGLGRWSRHCHGLQP